MEHIGKIFLSYRKKLKLSQQDICDRLLPLGLPTKATAYSTWETGSSIPNAMQFLAVCRILGIENIYDEFIGGHKESDPLSDLNEEGKTLALNYISLLTRSGQYKAEPIRILPQFREIRLYDIPASAGTGQFLDSDGFETIEVGPEVPDEADFGIRISGDSMMPRYLDRQIVWVQQCEELNDGEIGIFYFDQNAYCKKLQRNQKGTYLISLNTNYAPMEVTEDSGFKVFGRVLN